LIANLLQIKLDYFNKQGWGYKDSEFAIVPPGQKNEGAVTFTGNKYLYSGHILPDFRPWVVKTVSLNFDEPKPAQQEMEIDAPIINHEFLKELENLKCFSRRSFEHWERIMHSHGASLREVFALRYGRFDRYVDVVIYPISTEQVVEIVKLANAHNVIIVPYGGGTNVTQALWLRTSEKRMIVSLDMSRMDKILWVDKDNMTACVQAGIRGQDLERDLRQQGVISGHEPDSSEFSTLGGWLSTRASGMKKNTYGNIEEIVQSMTLVTSKGIFKK
jgi:alkyldihydroxyacetonephosphate synthase